MTPIDTPRTLSPAEMALVAAGGIVRPDPEIVRENRRRAWSDERVPRGLKWLKGGAPSRRPVWVAA